MTTSRSKFSTLTGFQLPASMKLTTLLQSCWCQIWSRPVDLPLPAMSRLRKRCWGS